MFHLKSLVYFILFRLIVGTPQLNLFYTDWVSESDNDLQHNCLRVNVDGKMISFCLSELPSKFKAENNDFIPKFTFVELCKQNITSQQLYLWSAPIDLIERYQFYLNQLSTCNDSLLSSTDVFYNCTIPRFGPKCEYELHYHYSNHSSLFEIINEFYSQFGYLSKTLSCYTHLQCNRGSSRLCLDWTEICNGLIDCLDGGLDEEHCWQLEINLCKDNEYRCKNGQCIPESFYQDELHDHYCADGSDRFVTFDPIRIDSFKRKIPTMACEDQICEREGLTSSCRYERLDILTQAMYSSKHSSVSDDCWSAFQCLHNLPDSHSFSCDKLCRRENTCIQSLNKTCPDVLYFPGVPVLFGNIYFAFAKKDSQDYTKINKKSFYICYENSHYNDYFINAPKILFKNMTCIHPEQLVSNVQHSPSPDLFLNEKYILRKLYAQLKRYHLSFNYTSAICNRSSMYQCIRSVKCISVHRLMDGQHDCPFMDDENMTVIHNTALMEQLKQKLYFKCPIGNQYIFRHFVKNGKCDCKTYDIEWCEDEFLHIDYLRKNIIFQHICDGFVDLLPIMVEKQNETDETECEQWKCNNIYTRCNHAWNCPNGADESGCSTHSTLDCSSNHHLCVSPDTNQFICLPIEKANDGKVDCLGATDEPALCGIKTQSNIERTPPPFYCRNQSHQSCISNSDLCDGVNQCEHGDDEQFCTTNQTSLTESLVSFCDNYQITHSNVEHFLCAHRTPTRPMKVIYFKLDGMIMSPESQMEKIESTVSPTSFNIQMLNQHQPRCHRGLDLRVWLNKTSTKDTCLCPPSYYGSQCQFQNQRISLIVRFRALSDSYQTLFAIVVLLLDDSNNRIIHSYEQITYSSVNHCKFKFYINLLYSTRPKDPSKQYAIHIDFYEKALLTYRGSVLLPVIFPFLPVNSLVFVVDIPQIDDNTQNCSNDQCIHGQCIKYSNNNSNNFTFCQCKEGWSGRYCTIQHSCTCASDSLCIGVSANNRSICVCPPNKFGSRCLLTNPICQNNDNSTCSQNGQCISNDDYLVTKPNFICLCRKGFSGDRCEIADNKLILSFAKDIILSQQMFIHFIQIQNSGTVDYWNFISTVRSTTFRTISPQQDSLTIHWSQPFHLVFIEPSKNTYYLTAVQKVSNRSTTLVKMINPSDRCPHITEVLNKTIVQWHLIRRIKYYHLPCQNQSLNLSCFYDDVHLCLCYTFEKQRLTNCFNFEHNQTFNCSGNSVCQNGGHCLQDDPKCPTRSICICRACFYGTKCQFSTSGFGLSLDGILGYHISPQPNLNHQPFIIKMSLALTVIFIVAGFVNSILSMMTFKNKSIRQVGCGLYLLGSSITSLLTMIMFGLKFLFLLLTQMTIISNHSFLSFQCHSIDFFLRIFLHMDQWLNACVATERAITAIKGARFDKKKSKKAAKRTIIILLIIVIVTSIHDPIFRQLSDEENYDDDNDTNAKRKWCIVTYPASLQIYNYIIHTLHLVGPFLINLISSVLLITTQSRRQAILHKEKSYKAILCEQFQQHKHLLTAPIVLVILALPRLILTFALKCMVSSNDAWLFLVGYFISFIPPMLIFVVFILPSKFYKKEFNTTVRQFRMNMDRCFHRIS